MPEKFVIREVPSTRFVGITRAAKGLRMSQTHLTMCLKGQRRLSKAKAERLEIIRLSEVKDGTGSPA